MHRPVAIGVAIVAASASAAAWACRCPPLTPAAAYRMAGAVMLARVVDAKDVDRYRRVYTLEVEHGWKRDLGARATVATRRTTCMLEMAVGSRYLVYASGKPGATAETTLCSGSLPAADAAPALAWLGRSGRSVR